MSDLGTIFAKAVDEFARRSDSIAPEQWHEQTPDAEWDVRALVNHVLVEDLWAPPLLDGRTLGEVGDRFDGDQLGDDPRGAWRRASAEAVVAASQDGVLERTVHVSFGDISAREYVSQLVCDHVIHAWDLARAIGADERLDAGLVEFVWSYIEPHAEDWRAAGAFGPKVDVPPDADRQAVLLGLTGRRP